MIYFQVNEKCNGCLACVQNCPARALEAKEAAGVQTLFHNMARCARCATCWRICPQHAIEFQHMLQNRWDEVVAHQLVRCEYAAKLFTRTLLRRAWSQNLANWSSRSVRATKWSGRPVCKQDGRQPVQGAAP